jgi:hypothetical protein
MKYAGKVENGVVVNAIVGTAELSTELFGGEWHESDEKIPLGGTWDETNGFQPPAPPEE